MWHRLRSVEYNKMTKLERKAKHQQLTKQGHGCGVIVYDEDIPVAWCQFGRPDQLYSYDFGRTYPKLDLPRPDWRISCMFVDKHRRKEHLASYALSAAITLIKQHGGGRVEAYPMKCSQTGRPAYAGSEEMFKAHGFECIQALTNHTTLMVAVLEGDTRDS